MSLQLIIIIILLLLIIIIFCTKTIKYIFKRFKEKRKYNDDNDDDDDNNNINDDKNIYDMHYWLKKNYNFIENEDNKSLCKEKIIDITNNDDKNCNNISQKLCDGTISLKKITIPLDSKITYYLDSGIKLINGHSYCIHKPPPPLIDDKINSCDESWGFWQYSLKYERWQCKSKVPGIYNAFNNKFDACSQGKGSIYYDGNYLPNIDIPKRFTPEQFYSLSFQKKIYLRLSSRIYF